MAARVTLNGETLSVEAHDVASLVAGLGFEPGALLVEHNGVALRPGEWALVSIRDGDRIECVRIVAGG